MDSKTRRLPRLPKRPENGLLAWQATVGFISMIYSPDATLTVKVQPEGDKRVWQASIEFGGRQEQVLARASLAEALRDLWLQLEANFTVFPNPADAVRRPANFADDKWLDADTARTLDALIDLTQTVFAQDWRMMIVYQAVDTPSQRVKMRLFAHNNAVAIGGQGPSLREACRNLYRNAAPQYFLSAGGMVDDALE
ncbi:MAG: hypothetical protein IT320_03965 [Anaerolineae bacterium]|nr:hypothetical protein [Anaerolineae bacterium]